MIIRIAFGKQQIETRQDFYKIQINFKLFSLSLFNMISMCHKNLLHGEKTALKTTYIAYTVFIIGSIVFFVYTVWTLVKLLT